MDNDFDYGVLEAPDKEVLSEGDQTIEKLIAFKMTFRDSGCGISQEDQKRLFTNFSKLQDSQNTNKEGVGLGLSICKEIIHAYKGSIEIES